MYDTAQIVANHYTDTSECASILTSATNGQSLVNFLFSHFTCKSPCKERSYTVRNHIRIIGVLYKIISNPPVHIQEMISTRANFHHKFSLNHLC